VLLSLFADQFGFLWKYQTTEFATALFESLILIPWFDIVLDAIPISSDGFHL